MKGTLACPSGSVNPEVFEVGGSTFEVRSEIRVYDFKLSDFKTFCIIFTRDFHLSERSNAVSAELVDALFLNLEPRTSNFEWGQAPAKLEPVPH